MGSDCVVMILSQHCTGRHSPENIKGLSLL